MITTILKQALSIYRSHLLNFLFLSLISVGGGKLIRMTTHPFWNALGDKYFKWDLDPTQLHFWADTLVGVLLVWVTVVGVWVTWEASAGKTVPMKKSLMEGIRRWKSAAWIVLWVALFQKVINICILAGIAHYFRDNLPSPTGSFAILGMVIVWAFSLSLALSIEALVISNKQGFGAIFESLRILFNRNNRCPHTLPFFYLAALSIVVRLPHLIINLGYSYHLFETPPAISLITSTLLNPFSWIIGTLFYLNVRPESDPAQNTSP